ncbi:MAG: trypsin-like serine peptidase [Methylococcus sp.]
MKRKTLLFCLLFAGIGTVQADSSVLVFQNPDRNPVSTPLPVETLRASVPVPEPAATSSAITPASAAPTRRGPLVTIPPTLPDAKSTAQARTDFPEVWSALEAMAKTQSNSEPPPLVDCQVDTNSISKIIDQRLHPCTSFRGNQQLAQVLRYPWRTIGKLFMHMPDDPPEEWYEGSAQIVSTTGKQTLVATAAHNIWDAGEKKLADQIRFVPAYRDGVAAYGQYEFDQAFILKAYIDAPDAARYDVALLTLKPNSAKREAASYTGTLGLRWNVPYIMSITQIGYSASPSSEFTTNSIGQTFRKEFRGDNCRPYPGEEVLFSGSALVQGASGGAWIDSFRPYYDKNGNYVVSVVHGGAGCGSSTNIDKINTGAQFADDNIGELCEVAGCANPANPKR